MATPFETNKIKGLIEDVLDYPKKGIIFKDISPLLLNPEALDEVAHALANTASNTEPTLVAGVEARGFIFAPLVARILGIGFVPLRKPGKLPRETRRVSYELEYGNAELEVHTDAIESSDKVLIIDDVLATGGTASASIQLIEEAKAAVCGLAFVIEITGLGGRNKLREHYVRSLLTY